MVKFKLMFCMHNHFLSISKQVRMKQTFFVVQQVLLPWGKNKTIKGWKNVLEKRIKSFFCENYTTDRYFVKGLFEVMDIKTALLKTLAIILWQHDRRMQPAKGIKEKNSFQKILWTFFSAFFRRQLLCKKSRNVLLYTTNTYLRLSQFHDDGWTSFYHTDFS